MVIEQRRNVMLTNDEFYERILDQEERLEGLDKRKKLKYHIVLKELN
ncbi:hypothetical protein GT646_19390 [Clostridium butyricum]|nr:hypothetical protein [Clostridium butyricum]MZI82998.1 hypothetical protein [Clostridium butyricum]